VRKEDYSALRASLRITDHHPRHMRQIFTGERRLAGTVRPRDDYATWPAFTSSHKHTANCVRAKNRQSNA